MENSAAEQTQAVRCSCPLWVKSRHSAKPSDVVIEKSKASFARRQNALSVETRMRPKLLADLPPELAALIEDITIDSKGRVIPNLYSKLQASAELRKMLNISAKEAPRDVTQLSDAQLIQQLADQARELGIKIDLN